ncbi:MAG: glycosyltransferase family 4 protein [Dehalococcoidia bacterium]
MRILFLTPEVPYPPESGGTIKTASVLSYLRPHHHLHVLCFRRRPLSEEQARWAAATDQTETVPLRRGRTPLNLLRSYLASLPLSIERNRSDRMSGLVSGRLRGGDYDAVFVDSWLMAQYLPPRFAGLTLLHQHNAEHVLWQRQADRERVPLLRALQRLEYARVRRYEAAILPRFRTVFAVSEADRQALLALGAGHERVRLLPNLPDPALLERPPLSFASTEPLLLYFGTLSWQPNIEGLEYLMRNVLPLLRQRQPELRLVIAGKGAPPHLRRLAQRTAGVEFMGPQADAEPLLRRARLFIEATHTGGGTRVKLLNSLARGLPIVASPQGAEGLAVTDGEHLLLAGDPEAMAQAVGRLMTDDGLWQALSENGRALIRRRYLAESAFGPLDEALNDASTKA